MNKWFFILYIGLATIFSACECDEGFTHVGDYSYKLEVLGNFPSEIDECSGFTYINNHLFIINDGSGGEVLFKHDPLNTGVTESIELTSVVNRDWEAITHTDTDIIIASTGNNKGKNSFQKIYHIDKFNYNFKHEVKFSYPGQTSNQALHNFDAESIFIRNGKYCIFTKNRADTNTDLYTSPVLEGNFVYHKSLPVPARVTDAYYEEEKDIVLLLCNEEVNGTYISFICIVELNDDLSLRLLESIALPVVDKLEAITKKEGRTFYLGSELESTGLGLLYEFELKGL